MVKTAAPEHVLTPTLGGLVAEAGQTGLVLGIDSDGTPLSMRLFRPRPTRVTLVGGWWAARVLVLRCLAFGVLVAVRAGGGLAGTTQWTTLDSHAGGTGRRVWPMPGEHEAWRPADAGRLMLHLYDVGSAGPATRPVLGAWQTQLTVIGSVTPDSASAVTGADIVVSQQLPPDEAWQLATAFGHGDAMVSALGRLQGDMILAAVRSVFRHVWLTPTTLEHRLFGPPAR